MQAPLAIEMNPVALLPYRNSNIPNNKAETRTD